MEEFGYIETGRYVCGHPDLNEPLAKTQIQMHDGVLKIYELRDYNIKGYKAQIPPDKIKNVLIEDASTVQRKVSVGRLLLVGVFAFAWKKKKVEEMSYLTIQWNDGRFDHETIFEFSGKGAVQQSNTSRNSILKSLD